MNKYYEWRYRLGVKLIELGSTLCWILSEEEEEEEYEFTGMDEVMDAEIATAIQKIEDAKTEPKSLKDTEWFDGFNSGLDWAIRILSKDKSAY